jgi:catechol-2,3-dioxygenase
MNYGSQAAFLSAGGYHHHIGLNTWQSKGGAPAPANSAGLYHVAILFPDETIILYGHGPSSTLAEEKQTNPFFHRMNRKK